MVSVSQFLPVDIVAKQVEKYIKSGAVVKLFCDFTTPQKFKYFMIATVEPLQVFIINSEITEFIRRNAALLADQVDIPHKDHPFLTHDSVLNCIEAHRGFNISDLKNELIANFSEVYQGELKPYILRNVVANSDNLPTKTKQQIIQAIKQDNEI